MIGNTDKYRLIIGADKCTKIRIDESPIKGSTYEFFLYDKIDKKLNFDTHVKGICETKIIK